MKLYLFILLLCMLGSCGGYSPKTIEIVYKNGTRDTATYNAYDFEIDGDKLYQIRATALGGNEVIATGVKYINRLD